MMDHIADGRIGQVAGQVLPGTSTVGGSEDAGIAGDIDAACIAARKCYRRAVGVRESCFVDIRPCETTVLGAEYM